jgi:hypothetical protein
MNSNTLKFRHINEPTGFVDNIINSNGQSITSARFSEIDKLMKPLIKDELEKLRVSKPHLFVK